MEGLGGRDIAHKRLIFQPFLSMVKWEGRGSGADTKGNIIPQRICATSHYEWSIEKHNIGE